MDDWVFDWVDGWDFEEEEDVSKVDEDEILDKDLLNYTELYDSKSVEEMVQVHEDAHLDEDKVCNTEEDSDFEEQIVQVHEDGHLDESKIRCAFTTGAWSIPEELDHSAFMFPLSKVVSRGREIFEVFGIFLFNNTADVLKIFGKISISLHASFLIYDTPKTRCESLGPYECKSLLLKGPDRLESCYDEFCIAACLCDGEKMTVVNLGFTSDRYYDDTYYSEKPVYWNLEDCGYDRSERQSAQLVVHFVRYNNAIGAKINFKLVSTSGPNMVYGIITASSNLFPDCESTLFFKEEDEKVLLHTGEFDTHLSKSLVAVPVSGSIIIRAYLPGVAVGAVAFTQQDRLRHKVIGNIEVSIIWLGDYYCVR